MINPMGIPVIDLGQMGEVEKAAGFLKSIGGDVTTTGANVHSRFQGLRPHYRATGDETLFDSTIAVKTDSATFGGQLTQVSAALSDFVTEIRPLAAKLVRLRQEATEFVNSLKDEDGEIKDDWQDDDDKVEQNNWLWNEVNSTKEQIMLTEVRAHNRIVALIGGTALNPHGSKQGPPPKDAPQAPAWGTPEQKREWYDKAFNWVGNNVIPDWGWAQKTWDIYSSFEKGVLIDGLGGMLTGLYSLSNFNMMRDPAGWLEAWKGLGKTLGSLALAGNPLTPSLIGLGLVKNHLPGPVKTVVEKYNEALNPAKEFGKAMVAWDMWGKDPARAGGTVGFNIVTALIPGPKGGGAMFKGAGAVDNAAGAVDDVARVGGRVDEAGRFVDETGKVIGKVDSLGRILDDQGRVLGTIDDLSKNAPKLEMPTAEQLTKDLDDIGRISSDPARAADWVRSGAPERPPAPVGAADDPARAGAPERQPALVGAADDPVRGPRPGTGGTPHSPVGGADELGRGGDEAGRVPEDSGGGPRESGGGSPEGGSGEPGGSGRPPGEGPPPHDGPPPPDPGDGDGLPRSPLIEHGEPLPTPAELVVERGAGGLIERVNGQPVRQFVEDLARQRAARYLELRGSTPRLTRSQVGEVVSVLFDRATGRLYEGTNNLFPRNRIPHDLHPTLQRELDRMIAEGREHPNRYTYDNGRTGRNPHPSMPGRHSEVYAANRALWDRRALGLPDDAAALRELLVDNWFPYRDGGIGRAPMCANCHNLLGDVDSIAGKRQPVLAPGQPPPSGRGGSILRTNPTANPPPSSSDTGVPPPEDGTARGPNIVGGPISEGLDSADHDDAREEETGNNFTPASSPASLDGPPSGYFGIGDSPYRGASNVNSDPRLGPTALPARNTVESLMRGYDRFAGSDPTEFLGRWWDNETATWKYPQNEGFATVNDGASEGSEEVQVAEAGAVQTTHRPPVDAGR
jgi:hypothetical protein